MDTARQVSGPHFMNDRDRLFESVNRLARGEPAATGCLDRVPEAIGAQSKLGSAAAQNVEAGSAPSDDCGLAERQGEYICREVHVWVRAAT